MYARALHCVGINLELTLRVQEVSLIRNKDISIINHYTRSLQPGFSSVDVGSRPCDWMWASRSITTKIVLVASRVRRAPARCSPSSIPTILCAVTCKNSASESRGRYLNLSTLCRGEEINHEAGHELQFLAIPDSTKNSIVDHANSASPAIRIMTLLEFIVKSSIFTNRVMILDGRL